MNNNKFSFLLKYGLHEEEVFNFIKEFEVNGKVQDNRTEILKRGLNAFQYLIQVNEIELLKFLSSDLKNIRKSQNFADLKFTKSLALTIYASMICKKGLSEADLFESIILSIENLQQYFEQPENFPDTSQSVIDQTLDHMIKSIDFVFLRANISDLPMDQPSLLNKSYNQKNDTIKLRNMYIHGLVNTMPTNPQKILIVETNNTVSTSSHSENMEFKNNNSIPDAISPTKSTEFKKLLVKPEAM